MSWRADDWELLEPSGSRFEADPMATDEAIRFILRRVPDRESKTVAQIGAGTRAGLVLLAAEFGRVIAIDALGDGQVGDAADDRRDGRSSLIDGLDVDHHRVDLTDLSRFHGALDVVLIPEPLTELVSDPQDRLLAEIHACLVEGGLLLATFPALARRDRTIHWIDNRDDAGVAPFGGGCHELQVQYRLRRAGYQGLRIRRVNRRTVDESVGRETIFCAAVRRASN